jgi:rod shape-determining protein MreC
MLIAFVAIAVALMTMWFREGDSGALHRVQGAVHVIVAPVSAAGEFVASPVRGFFAWTRDLGVSRSQLAELRNQNERLRSRVAALEEDRLENVRLRELVKLAQTEELKSVAARVIGRPTNSWEGVITIDRGTRDGVAKNLAVIGPRGLLGQTVEVTGSTAKVRLITDQRSGVAALVQSSRATGVVRGNLKGGLDLLYVSRTKPVKRGDVVVTSGLGGVFPKGIVIGEVVEVDNSSGMLYQRISVKPSADIADLEEVLIVMHRSEAAPAGGGE